MRKWVLLAVIPLALVATAAIVTVVRLNGYIVRNRDRIVEEAGAALARGMSYETMAVSLAGGLGVQLSKVRIADDPRLSEGDFLRADRVYVTLRLLPALIGRYEIGTIAVDAPEVAIVRTENGFNFDSIGKRRRKSPPAATQADTTRAARNTVPRISRLAVRDARIRYIDRTASPPSEVSLDQLDLTARDVDRTRPTEVAVSAALFGSRQKNLSISGTVGPLGPDIDPARLALALDATIGPIAVDDLKRSIALPAELSSPDAVQLRAKAKGTVARLDLDVWLDASDADIRYGSTFHKPARVPLLVRLRGTTRATEIEVENATVRVADVEATGRGRLFSSSPPSIDLEWKIAAPQARSPITIRTSAPDLGSGVFTIDARASELRPAALGISTSDGSDALGEVRLQGEIRAATGDATATLTSSTGRLQGLAYSDLRADATMRNDELVLDEVELRTFGGTLRGNGRYGTRAGAPTFELRTSIRNVALGPLLANRRPNEAVALDGRLQGELNLRGAGRDSASIRQSLRGTGHLEVEDGVLKDVNIAESVLSGLTGIGGLSGLASQRLREKHPELFGAGDTRFDELAGSVTIAGNRMNTEDLVLRTIDYAIQARGWFDLDQRVELKARLIASEALTSDIAADLKAARYLLDDAGRIAIPFRLKGRLPRVRPKPEGKFIARALQRALLDTGLDELLGGGKRRVRTPRADTAEELLEEGLKQLFRP